MAPPLASVAETRVVTVTHGGAITETIQNGYGISS